MARGRPPKYQYPGGKAKSRRITVRLPTYSVEKLEEWIKKGIYASYSEAVHDLITKRDEKVMEELAALKRKIEDAKAKEEAYKRRIKALEKECNEKDRAIKELLAEVERLSEELMKARALAVEASKEGGGRMVSFWELVEEYVEMKEKAARAITSIELEHAEKAREKLMREINKRLDTAGIGKPAFWKVLNKEGIKAAREKFGEVIG